MTPPDDEAQILAIQHADAEFFRALLDRDHAALERLLAVEFLIVDVAQGAVHERAAFLEAVADGTVTFERIDSFPEEAVIRMADSDTRIVVGRTAMSFSDPQGGAIEIASRYTHVFRREGGDWRLLSAQGTAIS